MPGLIVLTRAPRFPLVTSQISTASRYMLERVRLPMLVV
jgi:hypothetical protein